MADFKILREMIKKNALIEVSNSGRKYQVTLSEPQQTSSVTIVGLPQQTLVIKADEFPAPRNFFHGSKGENKRSDFILITNTKNKKIILYIEMKSNTDLEWKMTQQLKGARCLMSYCAEIGNFFWDQRNFLHGYIERYVCIKKIGLCKQPTWSPPLNTKHDKPGYALKICYADRLEFGKLVGK
jgi:hypothetical protein